MNVCKIICMDSVYVCITLGYIGQISQYHSVCMYKYYMYE